MSVAPVPELRERVSRLMLRDRRRLERLLDERGSDPRRLESQVAAAEDRLWRRRAGVPEVTYPEQLPVARVRGQIAEAIRDHQVVVLAGETGSGKTTQLPKVLLELGRGVTGLIGHTQPRRIAARAVAERVAAELGSPLGDVVGYAVRFHDQVADSTLVKLMTDGILLAELRRDRDLLAYDTIVIDEAHERSLTIDFLLGYLKQLLPRRPDLKVVVTSATIDPQRLSRHFDGAPVLEVSGRTYPVEVRYRPLEDADGDQIAGIVRACDELAREGPGDVLVFLSGEREIRDAADALRAATSAEVVPLFGRLSAAEQHVVFAPHRGRRIVLATNVAETSLTVPGIRYVVDTGTARVSRFSVRTKVQRLPIERVSRASAIQRAGRCGRVANGVCIRLYDEADFESRPEHTDPEILRTNLASVLLQMAALDLGDVASFPFVEPPDRRRVRDGRQLLEELGALTAAGRLTRIGRQLAQLPLDPRIGRMVVEAAHLGCVREVLVIAAALSIQDPRERPLDKPAQAAQAHGRFADPTSDLLGWLNLWRYLEEQQEELSGSAFRRLCRREFLHYLRIREWQDLHGQLRRIVRRMDLPTDTTADPARVTQALLAGLLSHVGVRQEQREFLGARGTRFVIAPGTPLAKKPPPMVVAAELVETTRLYARGVARVEPEWVERAGAHLVRRTYSEPHWSKKRGSAVAYERVTLYGVPIVARRVVQYGAVDPALSRELFLRSALVEGEWHPHHAFWKRNQQVRAEIDELARRARRPDLMVDDEALYAFYDKRIPDEVVSARHFDRWWKRQRPDTPHLLDVSGDDLVREQIDPGGHPSVWVSGDLSFDLTYHYEPATQADGVTVDVPLAVLNRVRAQDFAWQVPGLRHDLVAALVRSLPKSARVQLGPAPNAARALLDGVEPGDGDLFAVLSRRARAVAGVTISPSDWDLSRVPQHLLPTYRVVDERGQQRATGKDLAALQAELAPDVRAAIASAAGSWERSGATRWEFGDIPVEVSAGATVGYLALVDERASVALRVLPAPSPAVHHAGVRRLLLLNVPSPVRAVSDRLSTSTKLALSANPHGSLTALMSDCTAAAVDALLTAEPRTAEEFATQLAAVRGGLVEALHRVLTDVAEILRVAAELAAELAALPAAGEASADLAAQRERLVHDGFVTETGAGRLPDVARYLRAAVVRAHNQPRDPARDAVRMADVRAAEKEWAAMPDSPAKQDVRWLIEELRVSLFAPAIKAKGPVSVKRIFAAIDGLADAR